MTGSISKSEVLSGPERRRRWAPAEKLAIVAETYEPGMSVSLVARRHGIAPNQVFSWRRLANQGALTATAETGVRAAAAAETGVRAAAAAETEVRAAGATDRRTRFHTLYARHFF
jgi:transposase-like protein